MDKYTGWWNSLSGADFDLDGDMDYVAGNLGLNTQYKVSQEEPMRIIAKDFDMNGRVDPVCTWYVQGKSYPFYHRNLLLSQIPSLKNRYKTYDEYAKASIYDIFPENTLTDARIMDCRFFESAYIENLGNGSFEMHPLPIQAQTSPVFGILTDDFNSDGNPDILLTGNSYSSNIYTGQYDAFTGLFLSGNGEGGFLSVLSKESGFYVPGDGKALAKLHMNDGTPVILAAQNSDTMKVYKVKAPALKNIRLEKDDMSAEIVHSSGKTEYREFPYGSGYLSQSSRILTIPLNAGSITISGYKSNKRKVL